MIQTSCWVGPEGRGTAQGVTCFPLRVLGLCCIAFMLAAAVARAESPDDEYLRIYRLMEKAEALETSGQKAEALTNYHGILLALKDLQKANPNWNRQLVSHRTKTVTDKILALSEKPAEPATGPTTAAKSEVKAGAAAAAGPVKLLDAGAEPRKVLRYHPKAGDKQKVTVTVSQSMEFVGLPTPPTKIPAVQVTFEVTVKSVTAEGDVSYDWVVEGMSLKGDSAGLPQAAQANALFAGVKGLSGSGQVSSRGVGSVGEVKLPGGGDALTRQALEQMKQVLSEGVLALPEEAVGVGAKWEAESQSKAQGLTITQAAALQVVSLDQDRLAIKGTITQKAANQKIENPAAPGLKMDLVKMVSTGSTTITLDLARLYAEETSADMRSEMTIGMDVGGQKQEMNMKMTTNVRMEAK